MSSKLRTSLFTLTALAAAAILAGCGSSSAADLPAAAPTPAPNPSTTVVLVHGAWADGFSWAKVTAQLQQRGLNVVAVQLPRNSLADDAATVRRAIDAQPGQGMLVGHSYGGAVITEAGTDAKVANLEFLARIEPVQAALDDAENIVREDGQLRGLLRVSMPTTMGIRVIIPRLSGFTAQHPQLHVELPLEGRAYDMVKEAVRVGVLPDSGGTARRIATMRRVIVGAPAYFSRHGMPAHPAELSEHRIVGGPVSACMPA